MESLTEQLRNWSKPKYGLPDQAKSLMAQAADEIERLERFLLARQPEPAAGGGAKDPARTQSDVPTPPPAE